MVLKKLVELIEMSKSKETKRLIVAAAEDEPVLEAVVNAKKEGIIIPTLIGDKEQIEAIAKKLNLDINGIEIIDEKNPVTSSQKAVALIKAGKGDILMKGLVATADLLKAVLNKENGLKKGALLSHLALFESNYYHKLLGVTDAAMNVAPTFEEKVEIINNSIGVFHKIGIQTPKVAVISAVEVVNPKMECTIHASMLTMMNKRGQIKGCLIDGPLGLDNAVSAEAAKHKKIVSEVAGDCDMILCPDIEAANVLYKTMNFLGGAVVAAVILGASVPVVLTSRADSDESKLFSIALSTLL